jgi:hypothetical protein
MAVWYKTGRCMPLARHALPQMSVAAVHQRMHRGVRCHYIKQALSRQSLGFAARNAAKTEALHPQYRIC